MTKIKNFRINLRPREVARWLKNQHQVPTPDIELAVDSAIKEAKALLQPAAVYTTLTRATAEKATSLAFPDKAVAASIAVATIGPRFDEERLKISSAADPLQAQLALALREEALQQSVNFAVRLLQEQAKEEECELSAPVFAEDPALRASLATLLGSQRIGVSVDEVAADWPSHARLLWIYWTPVRRAGARKAEAGAKTTKAAA